jgi:integrase/ribosomal protein L37AE/L43A
MVGFQNNSVFGEAGQTQTGKSDIAESAGANPPCPQCSSKRIYRAGLRYLADSSSVQRWLCRDCGYRFSEKPSQENSKWSINTQSALTSRRQICALEAKNLDSAAEIKTVAGDKKKPLKLDLLPEVTRGYIVKFEAYLERNGYDEDNTYPSILTRLAGADAKLNLLDPESVKAAIASQVIEGTKKPWSNSMKAIAVCAYGAFCEMEKISWDKPVYHQDEIEIIAPNEKDLDLLIANAKKPFATFLQCLKETFADPSEVLACKWVELRDNVLFINHPVKRHNPGHYELSNRLMLMLNSLPRKDERIFPWTYKNVANNMRNLRQRVAKKFGNPAVLLISLKSFRHWGGTMLAYATNGNVPKMAAALRHKDWKSTQRYTHILNNLVDDDFDVTSATTLPEILELGKNGWQKYDEVQLNGVIYHCYRKPKRFGSLKTEKSQNYGDKSQNSGDSLILT